VRTWLERLLDRHPDARASLRSTDAATRAALVRLAAASEFAAGVLLREWPWFAPLLAAPGRPPDVRFRARQGEDEGEDGGDLEGRLRRFRNRALLHVLWRELTGHADVLATLDTLSRLAEELVAATVAAAEAELAAVAGTVRDEAGRPQRLVVLAMGKLGGRELNFSSDIDLIFLYPRDGESDGGRRLGAPEYFGRLVRRVVALLERQTADGFAYRVDTRLRPFGDSGPPLVSFGALESYLVRHGRGWERYAYVKARVLDTGAGEDAVRELMEDIVQPFVYRRYLDYGVFESLREMKALIAAEARRRRLAGHIKLGPGGIREIEFIAQSLQLVRGGAEPALRTPSLLTALARLAGRRAIAPAAAAELERAWLFLRRLENWLQAIRDQQTHALPEDPADRARLALALGHAGWESLAAEIERHRATVSAHFAAVAFRGDTGSNGAGAAGTLSALWAAGAPAGDWEAALAAAGFTEAPALAERLAQFASSAAVAQMGQAGARRLARFMPALLESLRGRSRPALVLERVLTVVEKVLRRSAYVALLNENPAVRDRLLDLCEQSAWLTEEIGRYPLLLDELLDPRERTAAREELKPELARRLEGIPDSDDERRIEALAQFQRAALFRIAVADVSGELPIMKVSDRLTELAEIVLEEVLAMAWAELTRRHGRPRLRAADGWREAGFGVIAYGKFAGMELSYRSDLDLVFLHEAAGETGETDGARPLDNATFFVRLVRRIVHLLDTRTGSGAMYRVDTRLRPSGRSGLLVTSIEAFERYQEENAWTWEHQALLRSRPVAGSAVVAREFERVRSETLRFRVRREVLREDVIAMRRRMREQLDRSDDEHFDLKQGRGGIADIEFLVQYLALENAERHPAVIHYPDNIRQLGTLGAAGCLPVPHVSELQAIYRAYRLRLHRLALDEAPPLAGAAEFAEERAFVVARWEEVFGAPPP
jgi:glutamate-ammonia-ligase adenylyltransferase